MPENPEFIRGQHDGAVQLFHKISNFAKVRNDAYSVIDLITDGYLSTLEVPPETDEPVTHLQRVLGNEHYFVGKEAGRCELYRRIMSTDRVDDADKVEVAKIMRQLEKDAARGV